MRKPKNKILRVIHKNGREYQYHATKGWRSYRATNQEVKK